MGDKCDEAMAKFEEIIEEWNQRLAKAQKKGQKLFGNVTEYNALNNLVQALALNRSMSVIELISALSVLENIHVKTEYGFISFAESLKQNKLSTLSSYDIIHNKKDLGVSTEQNSSFYKFIVENHTLLLQYYERAYFHALGELPVSEIDYDDLQLKESQAFFDLETTSKGLHSADKLTVVPDLKRGGVTIQGVVINGNNDDNKILKALQDFTHDSLVQPHSKASKILNFGGQFLESIMLQEFSNSTIKTDSSNNHIDPGVVKAHINWYSEKNLNRSDLDYYATIDLKILTCAYADPENLKAEQQIFAIGSDGESLITMKESKDIDEIQKLTERSLKEHAGLTEGNVTPICELKAKVKIEETEKGCLLKVVEFKSKFNTPDLESTKAHLASPIDFNKI